MSAPCLALCACACLVTPWCLKLKMLFTCLMNVGNTNKLMFAKVQWGVQRDEHARFTFFFLAGLAFSVPCQAHGWGRQKVPLWCYEWPWDAEVLCGQMTPGQQEKGWALRCYLSSVAVGWGGGQRRFHCKFSNSLLLPAHDLTCS